MADTIQLDASSFFSKVQKLHQHWQKDPNRFDAFLAVQGKVKDDEPERPETSEFIMWLLHWEFSDTIIVMKRDKVIFGVSPKKASLLNSMQVPAGYDGPTLQVLSRNLKQEEVSAFVTRVLAEVLPSVQKVALFQRDKIDGELSQKVLDGLNKNNVALCEMSDFFTEVQLKKLDIERQNMQMASNLTEWTFERVINEVEAIIEEDKKVKHSHIQGKIEGGLDNDNIVAQFLDKHRGVKANFLEYPLPVQIQSGNTLQVNKFEVDSNDEKLVHQAVYINVCGKFCDMSAMASRTLLINPSEQQKQAYMIANEALDCLIKNLTIGQPISKAYSAAKNLVMQKNPDLNVPSNFGFGIGFNYKERKLTISAQNDIKVEQGMTFHVRVALSGISKDQARSVVAIGDTISIRAEGEANQVLTNKIQRDYRQISYVLDGDVGAEKEESKERKPASAAKTDSTGRDKSAKKGVKSSDESGESYDDDDGDASGDEGSQEILKAGQAMEFRASRLRSKADDQIQKQNEIEDRKSNQTRLHKLKTRDLLIRYNDGKIQCEKVQKKVKQMDLIRAYKSISDYPKDLEPGKIYVDKQRFAVLIPNSQTTWIPVHISTIKSASDLTQGQWTLLRINFHTSGGQTMAFPQIDQPNALWMQVVTLKTKATGPNNRLSKACREIKECIKQQKQQEQERDNKNKNIPDSQKEQLTLVKNRRDVLDSLVIRPNLVGRKTTGCLEIHQNGVRFISSKGHKVDICFSNVKHLFYQPCAADELVVIIHFHLKNHITINDKPTKDIQFYKESGIAAEDINFKGRHKMNEMDELEQEEAERHHRARLNKKFLNFAKLLEDASARNKTPLEVDIPLDDLAFQGCPLKQVVKIRPTKECLVALSEFPFFVLDVNEIEVVHFERMYYGMKNFDLAIVMKDFQTYQRINSIPTEYTEELRSYFNELGLIYIESTAPFKWDLILANIRDDFTGFIEEGAWMQFVDDGDEGEDEESEDESDPACSFDDEDGESESEYSDDLSDEESSDVGEDSELSEEGESWDELEKRALEEDKKQATMKQKPGANRGEGNRTVQPKRRGR